jgi:peptide/nickel transport system substrate-binding protein
VVAACGPARFSQRRTAVTRSACGVVFCLTLFFAACGNGLLDPAKPHSGSLTIALPEATVSGPRVGFSEYVNILSLEGLTNLGADGRAAPMLASHWEWEEDYRRLRVYLRPDVVLHDGRTLDAPLAAALLRDAITTSKELYPALNDIDSVGTDGDLELVLDLSETSGLLPEDLSVLLRTGEGGTVGTGPYRVVSRDPKLVVLEGFDRFYLGPPTSISRVEMKPIDTLRTSWSSLLRGEVDMVSDVPADAVAFIRNDEVQIESFDRWYQFQIAFNSQKGPFRSPEVRRALNLAIDRGALIRKVFQGAGQPSTGPIWPQYWAYDKSIQPDSFDPAQAAALLDAAGYPMSAASGSRPPARFRFTCLLPEKFSVWERIALEVQKSLFDIGVDMQFQVLPVDQFSGRILAGNFDAILNDMISGPTPGRAFIFWRSARTFKGTVNVFGYENPEAERLFNTLRRSTNEAAIRSTTRRLQQVLLNDPPALFLTWNTRARAIRRDFVLPDAHRDPLLTVSRWTVGTPAQVAESR